MMTRIRRLFSQHKLSATIAAAMMVMALGIGSFAMANSGSNKAVSGSLNATKSSPLQQASSSSATPAGQIPAGSTNGNNSLSTAKVIPFQQGAPSSATPVGQIPAGFKDGDGTLVTGTMADSATAAAVAAFPGGTANRVSVLSDGEYNVHIIAVNWPHHVFVDQNFKVVGAE